MTHDRRVTVPSQVIYQKVGKETVFLNLETWLYYGLDPVGSRIWELLLEHQDQGAIIEAMTAEYDTTTANLQNDISHLLQDLQSRGLIEIVDSASP